MTANLQPAAPISRCLPPTLTGGGYLLLDPAAFDDGGLVATLNLTWCSPINWGKDLAGLPALVDLARCDAWQKEWLASVLDAEHVIRQSKPLTRTGIGAYIEAPVSLDELAGHLANRLLVLPIHKSGNRSPGGALWRFFDPRVFANLCWMLAPGMLTALTEHVSGWSFPWLNGWFRFDAVTGHSSVADMEPLALLQERSDEFTRIDIDVWDRAQRISSINQVLARIDLPAELSWEQQAALAARVESALVAAEHRLHWDQREDRVRYAEYAVRYGPAFLAHPKLSDSWAQLDARTVSMNWAELIALLTPEEHQALASHAVDQDGTQGGRPVPNQTPTLRT